MITPFHRPTAQAVSRVHRPTHIRNLRVEVVGRRTCVVRLAGGRRPGQGVDVDDDHGNDKDSRHRHTEELNHFLPAWCRCLHAPGRWWTTTIIDSVILDNYMLPSKKEEAVGASSVSCQSLSDTDEVRRPIIIYPACVTVVT